MTLRLQSLIVGIAALLPLCASAQMYPQQPSGQGQGQGQWDNAPAPSNNNQGWQGQNNGGMSNGGMNNGGSPSNGGDANGGQRQGPNLDQMMQIERQDFGIAPTRSLHPAPMHGSTPSTIPGGQVVTTKGLVALVQGHQAPYVLVDVLGGDKKLPDAVMAPWLAEPGSFDDQTQQRTEQLLGQATKGNKNAVLVFYCASRECWMSYNASLRAIQAGYKNVLWYRGGLEAWSYAGLPMTQVAQQTQYSQYPQYPNQPPQQPQYQPQQQQQPQYQQQPQPQYQQPQAQPQPQGSNGGGSRPGYTPY